MKEQARDTMIRDKFIAGQGQCALRRQLDGFAQGTPIGEIVDSCRVCESHSEQPSLGTQKTAGKAKGSAGPSNTKMDRRPSGHPTPVSRNLDREMRPTKDIRSVPRGNRDVRTRGVQEPIVSPLSPLAESFTPRPTSEERQTQPPHTDNDLDRSLAKTGLSEMETPRDSIKCKIATIGTACPIKIGKPVGHG